MKTFKKEIAKKDIWIGPFRNKIKIKKGQPFIKSVTSTPSGTQRRSYTLKNGIEEASKDTVNARSLYGQLNGWRVPKVIGFKIRNVMPSEWIMKESKLINKKNIKSMVNYWVKGYYRKVYGRPVYVKGHRRTKFKR